MLRNDLTPMQYRVRFLDGDIERTHYTDDRRYFEELIARHGHLTGLRIEPLTLTPEQQQRLDSLPAGLTPHDAGIYVRYGTTESEESPHYDASLIAAYHRDQVEPAIKAERKRAESVGLAHNGIRYAGDPSNRQAMQEALMAADDGGMTVFSAWKDGDGNYHNAVPVADVRQALRQIGQRRAHLIELEAQYVVDAAAGEEGGERDWSTPFD